MKQLDWVSYSEWHALFDALCRQAGYHDDAALAGAYCELANTRKQKDFESAVRNLNNWRAGRHVPQPRHANILGRLMGVTEVPGLQQHWNTLYTRARAAEQATSAAPDAPAQLAQLPAEPVAKSRQPFEVTRLNAIVWASAIFCAGAAAGSLITASGWRPWPGPAGNAPIIPFEPVVTMKVGESRPIYAYRGDCGQLPPTWENLEMPTPTLGSLSDGGLARRNSKFCQGLTPGRAVVFSATQAGTEEFKIQGDFFKVTVAPN